MTFRVSVISNENTVNVDSSGVVRRSAFDLLMQSSKDRSFLPDRVADVKNNKHRLQNTIIDWMQKNSLYFSKQAVATVGNELSSALTNVFWNIDGHEVTLAGRSHNIPDIFTSFLGFNKPEAHHHRKRERGNMSSSDLSDHSAVLFRLCGSAYMKSERRESPWFMFRENLLRLADNLRKHATYLQQQRNSVSATHSKIQRTDEYEWQVYSTQKMNATVTARYSHVNKVVNGSDPYSPIFLNDYTPTDPRRRFDFLRGLRFDCKVVRFSYTSSKEHLHFLWKVDVDDSESTVLQKNGDISADLKSQFPKYFSRAMKREFMQMFGRVTNIQPVVLREIFKRLTGDQSAELHRHEHEIHERLRECIDGEDDTLVWDLRLTNSKRPEQYLSFLDECQKYIASTVETAVDDRRHDKVRDGDVVTHLATALNAKDLYKEVVKRCPEGTPIPSVQWLRWQFWPRHAGRASSTRYS